MSRPRSAPRSRVPLPLPSGYGPGVDRQTVGLSSRHQGRCVVSVWILPYRPLFGCAATPAFQPDNVDMAQKPNAAPQPLPEAGARHEQRLEAVACTPLILIEAPSPADHRGMLRVAKPVSQTRRRPQGDSTPHNIRFTVVSICTPAPWTSVSSTKPEKHACTAICQRPQRRCARPFRPTVRRLSSPPHACFPGTGLPICVLHTASLLALVMPSLCKPCTAARPKTTPSTPKRLLRCCAAGCSPSLCLPRREARHPRLPAPPHAPGPHTRRTPRPCAAYQ